MKGFSGGCWAMAGFFSIFFALLIAVGGVALFIGTRAGNRRAHAEYEERLANLQCQNCGAAWKGYRLCSSCKRVMDIPQLPRDIAPILMLVGFVPLLAVILNRTL